MSARAGHSWAPASACVPGCLPSAGTLSRVGGARVAARLVGLVTLLMAAGPLAVLLPVVGAGARQRVLRGMFRRTLATLGVRLVHLGPTRIDPRDPGDPRTRAGGASGVLVVANHLSWLDILVLGAVQPMRMVAKREIRGWPGIGALAARFGTLFIDRDGLRTLPGLVGEAAEALRGGAVVGLFPEGTTWCGAASGPFRRAGFQAALDAGVPVRPVAQRMRLPDGTPTGVGAFIGDATLLDSLMRVVRLPELVIEVEVLPALWPEPGLDRRELARRAELSIAAATGVPAPSAAGHARSVPAAARPAAPAEPVHTGPVAAEPVHAEPAAA